MHSDEWCLTHGFCGRIPSVSGRVLRLSSPIRFLCVACFPVRKRWVLNENGDFVCLIYLRETHLNQIIDPINVWALIVCFHALQHRRQFVIHLWFEFRLFSAAVVWRWKERKQWAWCMIQTVKKLWSGWSVIALTKSSICELKWYIFHPFTFCTTCDWLAKSTTVGRRSSRGFTSEYRWKWLLVAFHVCL